MAGLTNQTPRPTEIKLHQKSRVLDISFSDGKIFNFSCEFLRVYSPSAEVSGHSPEQEVLQTGKSLVNIHKITPVGNYAIQLYFTDGHSTGLYSWDLLYRYGLNYEQMWQRYLQRMGQAGASREPQSTVQSQSTTCSSCK
ncbi:DUF971 family protein [Nitrosomonas sp. PY1]|uniref:gamma-butyrobetaine hydroxylase-like domain-containing protein n=1 Tax=Nitrosomonas sp. PY1 TaxID=1803906 RepID=UPI001FC82A8E|nr:DUF971 domain-containing protein [Nitrosomonas sp. PY1]GKS69061.1 DUF971 family protein [Nitrosomonas sp. PY1]